ncbi:AfsR/SARP family transcriptional regulator [Qaidamihabitans albus]|uniref:AfsR/SARP family transcriptional regulator n=1 Tax=Qaidamihabitans albus TaxID=2795733 RepID=UPI0018F14E0D|nr:BTAD domain-containing putative transcriptional regulator [Qaidamihabitans albus]
MRFGVLGPLAVWTADGREVRVPEAKVRALLANLLLREGRPVPADRLADDLWGERLPGNPLNTLQTKVSQLRRALEAVQPGARALVVYRSPGYLLRVEDEALDVRRFRALVAQARACDDARARAALLTDALALWRGPALADFANEPFAAPAVQRLEEERLTAIEERAEARLALGEHGVLAGELGDLLPANPYRERLRALHLRALYRAGRQSEALASYAEYRRRLADELGLEPGPELAALHQAILRHDPALGGPGDDGSAQLRTNLPASLTELVGRADAVREVRALLGTARLVTLTGPGGVGKTRLALETASGLAGTVRDGVFLVELAGLERHTGAGSAAGGDPAHRLAEAVVSALGVREAPSPGTPAALPDRLADALQGKEMVLVLDNCESLVEPVATLAARLLRAAPRLRILATSRQPLAVDGEALWAVPPLGIPARGHLEPGRPAGEVLDSVRQFSAVRLFVARAASAVPGFALTEDNVHAIAAICRRLDGLPLALELAATRLRALGPHELLARLDDRFRLLATGRRDAPARQRTLRAMIDWSWELLGEAERVVLRRLAVHADGCGLAAAEAVCAGGRVAADDVLDLLARLVDRSLVVCEDHGGAGPRYRLLESVAAYCLDRLREAGEAEEVRLRHGDHYAGLAERADARLRGPEQRHWLEVLDVEAANLRAALDTLAGHGPAGSALRLARAMAWYWFLRGRLAEARRSLRSALAVPASDTGSPSARSGAAAWLAGLDVLAGARADAGALGAAERITDPAVRARALWFLGYVLGTIGDLRAAERATTHALAGFRSLGDRWGVAAALSDNAGQAMAGARLAEARRAAAESAELFRELGDRWGQLQASFALGALAQIGGEYAVAEREHREALRMAEELGLWPEVSYQLSWLGRVAMLTGDIQGARRLHERALRLAIEHGFTPGEMYARTGIALGARREGDFAAAEAELAVLRDWNRLVESEPGNALILAELGFVAEQRGDAVAAARLHREALAIARTSGDPRAVALALEGLAGAEALAGAHREAAGLLAEAERLRESVGAPLPAGERGDVDRIAARIRAAHPS